MIFRPITELQHNGNTYHISQRNPIVLFVTKTFQLDLESEKCKLYHDVITVLLRCARNQSFHLAQFNASISQFADHLAVLYAFIGEAQENSSVQVNFVRHKGRNELLEFNHVGMIQQL